MSELSSVINVIPEWDRAFQLLDGPCIVSKIEVLPEKLLCGVGWEGTFCLSLRLFCEEHPLSWCRMGRKSCISMKSRKGHPVELLLLPLISLQSNQGLCVPGDPHCLPGQAPKTDRSPEDRTHVYTGPPRTDSLTQAPITVASQD